MKLLNLLAVASMLAANAFPAIAQDIQEQTICNISAETCQNLVDNLQKRIMKINNELRKGSKAYSAEEMKKLEQKLKDAMEQLDKMEAKPPK